MSRAPVKVVLAAARATAVGSSRLSHVLFPTFITHAILLGMERPCKEWTGARSEKGYGVRRYKGKARRVHRVAWEEQNGSIPDGMLVLHHCDNPPCYEIKIGRA